MDFERKFMTIEEKKPGTTQPETKPDEVKKEISSDKITIDIEGVSLEVPIDVGKKLIEARQKSKKDFKDLTDKVAQAEGKAAKEAERANLLTLMKSQDADAVEAQVAAKYLDKIKAVENRIVKSALESALLSDDTFMVETKDDAVQLLQAQFNFKANDTFEKVVAADGKEVAEVVKSWLAAKPAFKRAGGATPTGGKITPGKGPTIQKNPYESLGKGLEKLLSK